MKCYLCLTEPDSKNSIYNDMLYVSLKSARQNTNLDLYVLYDGTTNGRCYEILKEFDVNIILHKFSHKKYLKKIYPETIKSQIFGHDVSYDKIAGAFMRFDIPFVEKEDEYVLYTDIDVIFQKDVSKCSFGEVKYLAASTEFDKTLNKTSGFNSGIMYLNVKNMKEISNKVFDMMKNGIRNPIGIVDQGYLNYLCFDEMTFMPIEFNWKPYWGYNKDAYIVHFHGMKPGGNFENSGFAMSQVALIKGLNNNWNNIDGYVYYMMQYYELLEKDGKEWISNFIAMNLTTIMEYYKNMQNQIVYVNQPVNNRNPMVVTGENPGTPYVRPVAKNINPMVVTGQRPNPQIVNVNVNNQSLAVPNAEKPKASYLRENKTDLKELNEEKAKIAPSKETKKKKPWYK